MASLAHQLLVALGRVVSTQVVLRPGGGTKQTGDADNKWDFCAHQSGMIGSALAFANAACGRALGRFPDPRNLSQTFVVSFVSAPQQTADATETVSERRDGLAQEGLTLQGRQGTREAR